MRIGILIIISLMTLIGCTETGNKVFLQDNLVPLVAPKIVTNSTIIDSMVTITSHLRMEDVKITYTDDGTDPQLTSAIYNEPIITSIPSTYRFKAFHPDWKSSSISAVKLYRKGITTQNIKWTAKANNTYLGLGETTLINHKKASLHFRDPQWVGFDSIAKATVTFKNTPYIKSMTIGYLVDTKSWIFPPTNVKLVLNEIDTIQLPIHRLPKKGTLTLDDIQVPIDKKVASMTIIVDNTAQLPEWHPGKGLKAWLFMDEWIFNERK